jgi:hypothetical protein
VVVLKKTKEKVMAKKRRGSTRISGSITISASRYYSVGEVADQNELPMMYKLNVSIESWSKNNRTLQGAALVSSQDSTRGQDTADIWLICYIKQ